MVLYAKPRFRSLLFLVLLVLTALLRAGRGVAELQGEAEEPAWISVLTAQVLEAVRWLDTDLPWYILKIKEALPDWEGLTTRR